MLVRPANKRSAVWDHFKEPREKDGTVVCNLCNKSLKANGSTGCMKRHLAGHDVNLPGHKLPQISPSTQDFYEQAIAQFIVTAMEPTSLVEDTPFIRLMSKLAPQFALPSRTTGQTNRRSARKCNLECARDWSK